MDELIYSNRISGEPDLYVSMAPSIYWGAFLFYGTPIPGLSTILFSETTRYRGYYLFADKRPADYGSFVRVLSSQLPPLDPLRWGGVVWIADADAPINNLSILDLEIYGKGFVLKNAFKFHIGNEFTLTVNRSFWMSITLDKENNRFLFSWVESDNPISFNANKSFRIKSDSRLEIPVCGNLAGSIRFLAETDATSGCFSVLDTAIKLFYTDCDKPESVYEISCPVFRELAYGAIKFQFSINPLDLLNKTYLNTYMAFLGISRKSDANSNTILQSNFRSDYSLPIKLMPQTDFLKYGGSENIPTANSALIIFSERRQGNTDQKWYTVPSGRFGVVVDAKKKNEKERRIRLLCGLSGTETVSVNTGDYMVFKAGFPAHVPQFPVSLSGDKGDGTLSVKEMDNTYQTAWVGFEKNPSSDASVIYHSQPQGNALFRSSQIASAAGTDAFMDFYPANSGNLGETETHVFFPLLTYCADMVLPTDKMDVYAFETQIMIPARKRCLEQVLKEQTENRVALRNKCRFENKNVALVESVTPQGFYIQISEETNTWERMQLASNRFLKSDGSLSPVYSLEFHELGATLQNSFQSNQLFLVVSSDVNRVLGTFMNEMQLDGWPFIIDIPIPDTTQWNNGQYENILIFKYCDQTLLERVRNIPFWTCPEAFNDTSFNGLPNLSDWLSEYIEDGINKYEQQGDADFYTFWSIATNPSWKGIIALKVNICLTTFPAELQGLLAGIDLNEFYAHHFGIYASTVKQNAGVPEMSPDSSMFGLIDYEDAAFRQYDNNIDTYRENVSINNVVDYDFRVLLLKVVFTNSCIANFNSYIAFTVNRLFGEKVKNDNRENLLILAGTYEKHDGVPSYTFNVEGDNLMELESRIIRSVEIIKTNFVTAVSQTAEQGGKVEAAFSFFGYIDFYSLEGFDLLSFGNESGDSGNERGLAFSNMQVTFDFPLASPTEQTYCFHIGRMSFDLGATSVRKGSLYNHFPLQLTGITTGTKEDTPTGRGFLRVELRSLRQQQAVSCVWYGLEFKLNMGSLGALAGNAVFDARFLTAWNVGGGASGALKLSGVNPQAPVLSLQGIVKLNIKTISLDIAEDSFSYLMKLNNISLNFLSLAFPSKGQVSFFLFGNPEEKELTGGSLGWYGGYKKK